MAKAVERSVDLDEHVLRDVFRVVVVAGELIGDPVDHRAVALHERMERGAVAGGRAGYEVRIGRLPNRPSTVRNMTYHGVLG